ncbi:deoxyhypusine hydroxylase [Chytridiales sp. JEL 0842]|nr:deoxyhypusine hydroxylase [Chytridiales sp. JEL 0842]
MPSVSISTSELSRLESILLAHPGAIKGHSTVPLKSRFRALFTLKALKDDTRAIDVIAKAPHLAFADPSALLKHELAYVLGQMKNPYAIPTLKNVLQNHSEDPMVRHEAAEALGAIGELESLEILKHYADASFEASREVRETCELAIAKIQYENERKQKGVSEEPSAYTSIDPAPPVPQASSIPTSELQKTLMDTSLPLFDRYKAMFALRNKGDEESVLALATGFEDDSALFRHEIANKIAAAYVFGQLQHPASVPSLIATLSKETEAPMVRHEAAEALGSIATPECLPVLEKFKEDEATVVKESCIVGLDMWEYEASGEFQYAEKVELN